ncbi:MAG: hypothetical protein J6T14_08805 [Clostridia bacterium]|nr:hypothetical protein [Clostridia bacterium]MBP5459368.1 hypothetical protein [Clostridia bacterium]
MKKLFSRIIKLIRTAVIAGVVGFVLTFTIYMTNAENKLIYFVVRPFLTKHYDKQARDRRI